MSMLMSVLMSMLYVQSFVTVCLRSSLTLCLTSCGIISYRAGVLALSGRHGNMAQHIHRKDPAGWA